MLTQHAIKMVHAEPDARRRQERRRHQTFASTALEMAFTHRTSTRS
jgi:hypothetical protein